MTAQPMRTPSASTARRRHQPADRRSRLITVLLWLCVLYFAVPLIWLVISSTKDNSDLFTSFGLGFGARFSLWENIHAVFTIRDGIFGRWLLNTLAYSLISAVISAALSTAAGYAFAKYSFVGQKALFSVILGAVMIPLTALAIPTFLLFSQIGLTNTPAAVILPSIVSPFGVYLMRVYAADAIPDSLIEAARVDGAGEFRVFWQICLRLLGPAVITIFLFALVATWNNYFLPLIMLNSSDLYPLTVGLAQLQATSVGGSRALFSIVITGSFISILPLVIAFLSLQKYWQSGLSTGSVKE